MALASPALKVRPKTLPKSNSITAGTRKLLSVAIG